jgi:hypothetical protein
MHKSIRTHTCMHTSTKTHTHIHIYIHAYIHKFQAIAKLMLFTAAAVGLNPDDLPKTAQM